MTTDVFVKMVLPTVRLVTSLALEPPADPVELLLQGCIFGSPCRLDTSYSRRLSCV